MKIKNELKENFRNILWDKKLFENISIYKISYKNPVVPKPLRIRFDEIDGFVISLDVKIKPLILFDYRLFNKICDKIKYIISKKVVLQIVLIIILEKSELIHDILTY